MAAGVDPTVLDGMKPGDRDGTSVELNGRASSLDSEESNGAALHVSLEERRADVDRALSWLKGEMVAMRRQDEELVKQLLSIRSTIQKLKRRQQDDWLSASDSSDSDDACGSPADNRINVATPVERARTVERVRKLSSGGLSRMSAVNRARKKGLTPNGTSGALVLTDASGSRYSPPVHLKQYVNHVMAIENLVETDETQKVSGNEQ
jgi:hypothetical protein